MKYQLQMYLNESFLDAEDIPISGYGTNNKIKLELTTLMTAMKKKHADAIKKAGMEPVFYLCNIPSSINSFRFTEDQN